MLTERTVADETGEHEVPAGFHGIVYPHRIQREQCGVQDVIATAGRNLFICFHQRGLRRAGGPIVHVQAVALQVIRDRDIGFGLIIHGGLRFLRAAARCVRTPHALVTARGMEVSGDRAPPEQAQPLRDTDVDEGILQVGASAFVVRAAVQRVGFGGPHPQVSQRGAFHGEAGLPQLRARKRVSRAGVHPAVAHQLRAGQPSAHGRLDDESLAVVVAPERVARVLDFGGGLRARAPHDRASEHFTPRGRHARDRRGRGKRCGIAQRGQGVAHPADRPAGARADRPPRVRLHRNAQAVGIEVAFAGTGVKIPCVAKGARLDQLAEGRIIARTVFVSRFKNESSDSALVQGPSQAVDSRIARGVTEVVVIIASGIKVEILQGPQQRGARVPGLAAVPLARCHSHGAPRRHVHRAQAVPDRAITCLTVSGQRRRVRVSAGGIAFVFRFLDSPHADAKGADRIGVFSPENDARIILFHVLKFGREQVFAGHPDRGEKIDATLRIVDGIVDAPRQRDAVPPHPFGARQDGDEGAAVAAPQVIATLLSVHAAQRVAMVKTFAAREQKRRRAAVLVITEPRTFGLNGVLVFAVASMVQHIVAQQIVVLASVHAQVLHVDFAQGRGVAFRLDGRVLVRERAFDPHVLRHLPVDVHEQSRVHPHGSALARRDRQGLAAGKGELIPPRIRSAGFFRSRSKHRRGIPAGALTPYRNRLRVIPPHHR